MEQTHADIEAFPNSSANKINFCLGCAGDELGQLLPMLPWLSGMLSQVSQSVRGWGWTFSTCDLQEGRGENTYAESLTQVQCIVMKIKDTLITAAKWYWTAVNAREGTSKNGDSWTSHKTKQLSVYPSGCKWGMQAAKGWTRDWATDKVTPSTSCIPSLPRPQAPAASASQGVWPGPRGAKHQRLSGGIPAFCLPTLCQVNLVFSFSSSFVRNSSVCNQLRFLHLTPHTVGKENSHHPLLPSEPLKNLDFRID